MSSVILCYLVDLMFFHWSHYLQYMDQNSWQAGFKSLKAALFPWHQAWLVEVISLTIPASKKLIIFRDFLLSDRGFY
jgi:hypothetical protein